MDLFRSREEVVAGSERLPVPAVLPDIVENIVVFARIAG